MRSPADANSTDAYLPKTTEEKAGAVGGANAAVPADPNYVFASVMTLQAWQPYPTGGDGSGAVSTTPPVETDATLSVPNLDTGGGGVSSIPSFTVEADITGTEAAGSTLTCDNGTLTGSPVPTITKQWKRNGVDIAGETGSTYLLVSADLGTTVSCLVTATNSVGSDTSLPTTGTIAGLLAPVVANQTLANGFGRNSLAGHGDGLKEIVSTGGTITSITLGTRTVGSNHFTGGSTLAPSAVPADAQYVWTGCTATGPGGTSAPFTLTINTNPNEWSVLPDNAQILAAYNAAGTGGGTIKLRAGANAANAGPISLPARAGTAELIITAYGYVPATATMSGARTLVIDARASVRPATIRGFLALGVIDRLTLRGLRMIRDRTTEVETAGIIDLYESSDHIKFQGNEISLLTLFTSRDHTANGLNGLMRGIAATNGTGPSDDWLIDGNWIHDLTRAFVFSAHTNSVAKNNILHDCYNHFTTISTGSDNVDLLDNIMWNVWAMSTNDYPYDPVLNPTGGAHSSLGLSFDAGISNIDVIGNVAFVGKARFLYDGVVPGATGAKFNDPVNPTSYQTIRFAENLIVVSANIGLELAGVAGADVFNNTIVGTLDHAFTPTPQLGTGIVVSSDQPSSNIRIWNNIIQGFAHGSAWTGTEVTGEYGNYIVLPQTVSGTSDHPTVFTGHPTKGLSNLTIEELIDAYVPKAGSYPATAGIGYAGSGYVLGSGGRSTPAFAPPAPTGGTPVTYPQTVWDGTNDFAIIASGTLGAGTGDAGTFVFQGANINPVGNKTLFSTQFSRILIYLQGRDLRVQLRNTADVNLLVARFNGVIPAVADTNLITLTLSYDISTGRVCMTKNGAPITIEAASTLTNGAVADNGNSWRIGANASGVDKFSGNFSFAAWKDSFTDTNTVAGLNTIYASTGALRALTGSWQLIYYGNKATLEADNVNYGTGNVFTLTGSVEDVGGGGGDTTAPLLTLSTAVQTGPTTATLTVTTDSNDGALNTVGTFSTTQPSALQVENGQDHTGANAPYRPTDLPISSSGLKTINATGLTPATTYHIYHMHKDAAGNSSLVTADVSFTTASSGYTPIYVTFDGTSDYLIRDFNTNITDAAGGTIAFLINGFGADGSIRTLFNGSNGRAGASRLGNNKLQFDFRTAAGAIWTCTTDNTYTNASGVLQVVASFDGSASPKGQVYINGVAAAFTNTVAPTTGVVDWQRVANGSIGGSPTGTSLIAGSLAYIAVKNAFIDLPTNIGSFWSGGVPVDPLGIGGWNIFFGSTMNAAAWNVGDGLGSMTGWTVNGAVA
jgi:hypothetical protein